MKTVNDIYQLVIGCWMSRIKCIHISVTQLQFIQKQNAMLSQIFINNNVQKQRIHHGF